MVNSNLQLFTFNIHSSPKNEIIEIQNLIDYLTMIDEK